LRCASNNPFTSAHGAMGTMSTSAHEATGTALVPPLAKYIFDLTICILSKIYVMFMISIFVMVYWVNLLLFL